MNGITETMSQPNKTVYVGMCADLVHHGHANVIRVASTHGQVIVGLLTDEAMASCKRAPVIPWENRRKLLLQFRGVDMVIEQSTLDYRPNLKLLRPDVVVHGDDWKTGAQQHVRSEVLECISQWGGKLVEPAYTAGVSTTKLITMARNTAASTEHTPAPLAFNTGFFTARDKGCHAVQV
jgi:phosphoenolpyruvate phosphomutase / 2-hydroxyethylphosphonate cytidylyltransferase